MYKRGCNRVDSLNLALFKKFIASHDVLTEYTANKLFIDSVIYISNIEDKSILSIAASMMVIHHMRIEYDNKGILRGDIDMLEVLNDPKSLASSSCIISYIRDNMKAVSALENKGRKRGNIDAYISVVKRVITEYFYNKSKRYYTDELLDRLVKLDIKIDNSHRRYPWRYIRLTSLYYNLVINDINNDIEMKDRLEKIAYDIITNNTINSVKDIINRELSS